MSPGRQMFYLHAYARGVDKRNVFIDYFDYSRFFLALVLSLRPKAPSMSQLINLIHNHTITPADFEQKTCNRKYGKPIVNVLSAILMPNHFHLHLSFYSPQNCSQVLQRLIGSYTKYFNARYKREGRLFSSKTKKVPIVSDEQNLYLTKYIHLNPYKLKDFQSNKKILNQYPWSTYTHYLGKPQKFIINKKFVFDTTYFCNPKTILGYFPDPDQYRNFILSKNKHEEDLGEKELIDKSD